MIARSILKGELFVLALHVYHDGWSVARLARAAELLRASRNIFEDR